MPWCRQAGPHWQRAATPRPQCGTCPVAIATCAAACAGGAGHHRGCNARLLPPRALLQPLLPLHGLQKRHGAHCTRAHAAGEAGGWADAHLNTGRCNGGPCLAPAGSRPFRLTPQQMRRISSSLDTLEAAVTVLHSGPVSSALLAQVTYALLPMCEPLTFPSNSPNPPLMSCSCTTAITS